MTKRNPLCIFKDCNKRGKRKIRFDVGPTLDGAKVPDSARIHTKMVCDDHFEIVTSGMKELGDSLSIGDADGRTQIPNKT